MQKNSKYSVVTQRIRPLLGLAAHKHFNIGAALRSECQMRPTYTGTCSGIVLGCYEAVVPTLSCVPPETVEETVFFRSKDWEAACDTSSPPDTPGC